MTLVHTLLPIFCLIALGWLALRSGYLGPEIVAPAGQIVIRIALPAVIFLALATTSTAEAFDLAFLGVYGVASLAVLALCYGAARLALGLDHAAAATVGMGVAMANSAFMGFPIGQIVLGQAEAVRVFSHVLIVENLVVLPLALILLALAVPQAATPSGLLRDMLRNPLLLALAAGGAVSATGLELPRALIAMLELLGRVSAPLALLVIGAMLATLPVSGRVSAVGLIVLGKLALHPLLVVAGLALVPSVSPQLALGGVLFAAIPMITIFPLLATRAGQGQLAAFGLLAATLGSFVTLPFVIHSLGLAQP